MTNAIDLLERFLASLPEGHPERPGIIRSLEVLRTYGRRPPTVGELRDALPHGKALCRAVDTVVPAATWICTRPVGHDGPHIAGGTQEVLAWWTDGSEAVSL